MTDDDDLHREHEPMDRLTRITAAMDDCLRQHPERTGDERCIIMLSSSEWGRGAVMASGYDARHDDLDAVCDVMRHLERMMRASQITTEDVALRMMEKALRQEGTTGGEA